MPASAKSDPGLSLPFNRAFVGVIQRYDVFQANPVVGIRVDQLSAGRAIQLLPLAAAGFQAGGVGVQEPAVPVSKQNKDGRGAIRNPASERGMSLTMSPLLKLFYGNKCSILYFRFLRKAVTACCCQRFTGRDVVEMSRLSASDVVEAKLERWWRQRSGAAALSG